MHEWWSLFPNPCHCYVNVAIFQQRWWLLWYGMSDSLTAAGNTTCSRNTPVYKSVIGRNNAILRKISIFTFCPEEGSFTVSGWTWRRLWWTMVKRIAPWNLTTWARTRTVRARRILTIAATTRRPEGARRGPGRRNSSCPYWDTPWPLVIFRDSLTSWQRTEEVGRFYFYFTFLIYADLDSSHG